MRVLVTGGAGFIGSNLVPALLGSGHQVAVVDDFSTGFRDNLDPRAELRTLDILSPELPAFMKEFEPDAVVHLAAQSSVTESLRDPEHDREVNAQGTRLVAQAALAAGAKRMISASSAAVYGEPQELPLRETSPKSPINPYGASKLEAESLLVETLAGSQVDHASFRFANVYGPRQNAAGEGGVVAIFLDRVAKGQSPVLNGDGTQTRDFIFVGDIVGAILTALAHPEPLARDDGAAYNISTGNQSSLNEVVGEIRMAARYAGAVEHAPAREGDIQHSVLDPSRAASVFGWHAGTELQRGLAFTWRWFNSQA